MLRYIATKTLRNFSRYSSYSSFRKYTTIPLTHQADNEYDSYFSRIVRHNPVIYPNNYNLRLKAAILDWSGTTVDADVIAPAIVFQKVFQKYQIDITMKEARLPMGIRKDLHIAAILKLPNVKSQWIRLYGNEPTNQDVQQIYTDFIPMQLEVLPYYSTLIPGTSKAISELRKMGIKIGSTTGFNRKMADILLKEAEKQGYQPDTDVAGDDLIGDLGNRPAPFMLWINLFKLNVWPIRTVVKVDDTVTGIEEGLNAGCWTVGVSKYSNYTNINSIEERENLDPSIEKELNQYSKNILIQGGAHYVVDSIADLPDVAIDINYRLARGERP